MPFKDFSIWDTGCPSWCNFLSKHRDNLLLRLIISSFVHVLLPIKRHLVMGERQAVTYGKMWREELGYSGDPCKPTT